MDNKELIKLFNKHVSVIGFKKTRNNVWYRKGEYVTEGVYLQKSMFGNHYYFRYGYVINELDLDGYFCHIDYKPAFLLREYSLIEKLFNLEVDISDIDRDLQLKKIIKSNLQSSNLDVPNSKEDLIEKIFILNLYVNAKVMKHLNIGRKDDKYYRL